MYQPKYNSKEYAVSEAAKKELLIYRIRCVILFLIIALIIAVGFILCKNSYNKLYENQKLYGHEFVRIKDTRCVYDDTSKVVYKQYLNGIVPLFDTDGTPLTYDEFINGGH